jgi:MFS family permease
VINAGTIILLQFFVSRAVKNRPALPTMVFGMGLGAAGWFLLGLSRNPLVFVAGLVVFSIGEMTAHPKYFSFVGLIAPPDRKAVYMGYAFLYGVFGSLIGSNLGALLYVALLKPVVGTPAAAPRAFLFWTIFAAIGMAAFGGLWFVGRAFSEDTPETRRRAAVVMAGVYLLLVVLGLGFLVYWARATPIQHRTIVQASLFILLGAGGLAMTLTRRSSAE